MPIRLDSLVGLLSQPIPSFSTSSLVRLSLLATSVGVVAYIGFSGVGVSRAVLYPLAPATRRQRPHFSVVVSGIHSAHTFVTVYLYFVRDMDTDEAELEFRYNATAMFYADDRRIDLRCYARSNLYGRFDAGKFSSTTLTIVSARFVDFSIVHVQVAIDDFLPSLRGVEVVTSFVMAGNIDSHRRAVSLFVLPLCAIFVVYRVTQKRRTLCENSFVSVLAVLGIIAGGPAGWVLPTRCNKWALPAHKVMSPLLRGVFRFYVSHSVISWMRRATWCAVISVSLYSAVAGVIDLFTVWAVFAVVSNQRSLDRGPLPFQFVSLANELIGIIGVIALIIWIVQAASPEFRAKMFWITILAGTALHSLAVFLLLWNRDFPTFASELWAVAMYVVQTTIVLVHKLVLEQTRQPEALAEKESTG
jgi:hypothetical protein